MEANARYIDVDLGERPQKFHTLVRSCCMWRFRAVHLRDDGDDVEDNDGDVDDDDD